MPPKGDGLCPKCKDNKKGNGPYCKPCTSAYDKARYVYDPIEGQRNNLKRNYGMTLEEYDKLFENQDGRCAICQSSDPGGRGRFHVDHDHESGVVQGLLCHYCNTGIGSLRDDPNLLRKAVAYLERSFKNE